MLIAIIRTGQDTSNKVSKYKIQGTIFFKNTYKIQDTL